MFQPSPFFYETYGTYFPRLLQARSSVLLSNVPLEINQRYYTASVEQMPHFSLILQSVNLPTFMYSKNAHAVLSHLEPPKIKRMTLNKGTQTEEQENAAEVWKYKELIGNLKPLWITPTTPPCELLFGNACNQTVNVDCIFEAFVIGDQQKPNGCLITEVKDNIPSNAITEAILKDTNSALSGASIEEKHIKNEILELPTSTSNVDKEYDSQWPKWGFQKAVTKRRGRKKNQNSQLYKDVVLGPQKLVITPPQLALPQNKDNNIGEFQTVTFTNDNSISQTEDIAGNFNSAFSSSSYATAVRNPKAEKDIDFLVYTKESETSVHNTYKDDPDFRWFEEQFPDNQRAVPLTQAERDMNFEVAAEFVRENIECEKDNKKQVK